MRLKCGRAGKGLFVSDLVEDGDFHMGSVFLLQRQFMQWIFCGILGG